MALTGDYPNEASFPSDSFTIPESSCPIKRGYKYIYNGYIISGDYVRQDGKVGGKWRLADGLIGEDVSTAISNGWKICRQVNELKKIDNPAPKLTIPCPAGFILVQSGLVKEGDYVLHNHDSIEGWQLAQGLVGKNIFNYQAKGYFVSRRGEDF
jgi:hypothetical protein